MALSRRRQAQTPNAVAMNRFALAIDKCAWPEESADMPRWPEHPDDYVDPAIAPLIEAGEGESEGFDVAEADLIRHAEHGDQHGTDRIWRDAAGFRAEEIPGSTTTATARATTRIRKPDG